jgi:hypothetical protein
MIQSLVVLLVGASIIAGLLYERSRGNPTYRNVSWAIGSILVLFGGAFIYSLTFWH